MFNRKTLVVIGSVWIVAIVIIIVVAIINGFQNQKESVTVNNINDCSKNIDGPTRETIFKALYVYVKRADEYNKVTSKPSYSAQIRKGSCKQEARTDSSDSDSANTTSAIVDVPDAKQSWLVSYHWVDGDDRRALDLGEVAVKCPAKKDLRYGDFHCDTIPALKKEKIERILNYLPIIVAEYSDDYSTYTEFKVDVDEINPLSLKIVDTTGGNQQRALNEIKKYGFNPSDYQISYEFIPIEPI